MSIVSRVQGDFAVTGKIYAGSYGNFTRDNLTQDLMYQPLDLGSFRVHDAYQSFLPSAGASDDLGLVGGTFGTDVPSIQTSDSKTTTVTQRARLLMRLPAEYVAAASVVLRCIAGMKTTASDGTATLDAEAYKSNGDTLITGSDLVSTAAQSINSTVFSQYDFVITPTTLLPGDLLDVRFTIAISDTSTGTAVIGTLASVLLGATVKG